MTSINKVKITLSKLLWGVIYTFLILLAIFTYVRTKVYFIPSSSMEGTLLKGDVVWTKKFDGQQLQRGDILMFQKIKGYRKDNDDSCYNTGNFPSLHLQAFSAYTT